MAQSKRNAGIDFWKFIAAIYIVVLHSYTFFGKEKIVLPYGYLAVEFFFIVSGYFFANSVFRDEREYNSHTIGPETWDFIWHKIKGFLYYWSFGFLLTFIMRLIQKPEFISVAHLPSVIFDFLLLRESGIPVTDIYGADWYLSSMIIVLFVIYPFFRKNKNTFAFIASPIITVFGIGFLYFKTGKLNGGAATFSGITTYNNIRAAAEICLGITAYIFSNKIKEKTSLLTDKARILLTVLENLLVIGGFLMIVVLKNSKSMPFVLLLFAAYIALATSQTTYSNKIYPQKISVFLGKLSVTIYVTHTCIRYLFSYLQDKYAYFNNLFLNHSKLHLLKILSVYVVLCILLGIVCLVVCDKIKLLIENKKNKQNNKNEEKEKALV